MSIDVVKQHYDENCANEWERFDHHPFEFIFTTYMMDKYICDGDSVLDIGGGPGRYSIYYAEKGCTVALVDLSPGNIALAREKAAERKLGSGSISMSACDCLKLDSLGLGMYDHVFLMGPLYHLLSIHERRLAVEGALSHLKPGGILYCSFILNFAGLIYDIKNGPGYIAKDLEDPAFRKLVDCIAGTSTYDGPAFTDACFIDPVDIEPFMAQFPLDKLHLFGQEGMLALNENSVLAFPKPEYELWIETAKRLLDVPALLSLSEHAMYIGRKR